MNRSLMEELKKWKDSPDRKPMILWGARQTGKTWLLKEFGRESFSNTIYISFYNNRRIEQIFEPDYDVTRILHALEIELHVTILPGETLLIFDEVQNAPRVVESLKNFAEDAPEYAVAAAGSLLGVALHEGISFPVGKVDELHLYPMSFSEFLLAVGEEHLSDYLAAEDTAQLNAFSGRYTELLKTYYVVGGMPEVVKHFRVSRDYQEARELQLSILHQYEGDFGKHIPVRDIPRVRMVWNSLPLQLAKENKKFFFGGIKKGARAKDYETALEWLVSAGLIYKVNKVSKPAFPLRSYIDFSSFKVYLLDVGLLGAMSELEPEVILKGNRAFVEFKGALTEQYVQQELRAETMYSLYYYSSEKSTFEVDFLFQKGESIVPLEVKAAENLKSHSLKFFHDKFQPVRSYRTSLAGYDRQDWMSNIPLWGIRILKNENDV